MLSIFLLVAISLLPGEMDSYRIQDFVKPEDCAVRRVGGKNTNLCDIAPAFDRIALDIRFKMDAVDFDWLGYGDRTGSSVVIPPGRFWLSRQVRFCRQMHVSGASGGNGAATFIFTPHSVSAFKFAYYDECLAAGLGEGSGNSLMENLNVYEATGAVQTSSKAPAWAFHVEDNSVELRNIQTYGYVQAFRISADVHRTPRTNANLWKLTNVKAANPEHAGIFVDGGDTNAGLGLAPNVVGGCTRGSYWKNYLGPCANQVYSDLIGSTIVAAHASSSHDVFSGTNENFPNYLFEGDGQKAICVGCYSESDLMPPIMAKNGMWIGVSANAAVGGFHQVGYQSNMLYVMNDKDPLNKVAINLGTLASAGTAFEAIPSGGGMSQPLRIKAEPSRKAWRVDVANLNSGVAARIGGTADAPGYGMLELAGTVTGTPAAALCTIGAFYLEKVPTMKGPRGYQCVMNGTKLQWRSF